MKFEIGSRYSITYTGEEAILLDMHKGIYWHLNRMAAEYIKCRQQGTSLKECAESCSRIYDHPMEDILRDLRDLHRDLIKRKVLVGVKS